MNFNNFSILISPIRAYQLSSKLRFNFLNPVITKIPGGAKRNRTADLLNAIQALSQLSYSPNIREFLYAKDEV